MIKIVTQKEGTHYTKKIIVMTDGIFFLDDDTKLEISLEFGVINYIEGSYTLPTE